MPAHAARVPVLDHGLLCGDGVFEGIRFYHGRAYRLDAHLARLYRSARAIRLTIPLDGPTLTTAVHDTIAAFGVRDGYLRLVVTRGAGKLGIDPSSCVRPNVMIIADELTMMSEHVRRNGARVIVAATRRLGPDGLDPRIKSLNYLNHILARLEAGNAGAETATAPSLARGPRLDPIADEAILLNGAGHVAEGTADNVFVVSDGALLTPPASDGALEGITCAVVLELADELGIAAHVRSLGPYDLYTADECFLTGTGAELIPVCEIDGRALGGCPGPIYQRIAAAFRALVERETQ
jgi:branched-chain amino acid aminotransferase